MSSITINNKEFSLDAIKKNNINLKDVNTFEKKIIFFCYQWLNNTPLFEVKTSGSTGTPKTIVITRQQMIASAKNTLNTLQIHEYDNTLVCLNPEHIAGIMMLTRGLVGKLKMTVIPPQLTSFETLSKHVSFRFSALVPIQLDHLIEQNKMNIFSHAKAIIIGGATINKILEKKCQEIKAPIYHTYGMTETVSHIAIRKVNNPNKKNYYTLLKGNEITIDHRKCLIIKGPSTNNKTIITNDVVKLIDSQHFYWVGRIDEAINSGGVKIHPNKIEQVTDLFLNKHKLTIPHFAAGTPNEKLGEQLSLFFEITTAPFKNFEKDLYAFFAKKLPQYEIPKKIFYLPKFQMTPTQKINKKETIKEIIHENTL